MSDCTADRARHRSGPRCCFSSPRPKPRRCLRLDFEHGLPANARTMAIVPVMLSSVTEVEELLERLEVSALANSDERLHFTVLSDFTAAPEREMPGDAELLEGRKAGGDALIKRFS